jgi:hypothetical protein
MLEQIMDDEDELRELNLPPLFKTAFICSFTDLMLRSMTCRAA